ncbi:zinc finger BED domain-containing protein 5-like [Octopus sinensis]|uniref:Zinc finger BED domain-containing protein 5-like n=1 Tax=Octopus sinensis TaxID=2607531 RepID=A0A6P7TQD3_9MOLL|nr:zinc finger BED domain-containing protein 5-like [Octopus sinensis]
MFREIAATELGLIPISNTSVSRLIKDMFDDIETLLVRRIKKSEFFPFQVDKSSDITRMQFSVLFRYMDDESIIEDFFPQRVVETTKGYDIFNLINSYFEHLKLDWNECIGICTDGALSVTGDDRDFVSVAKNKNPDLIHKHYFIHHEACFGQGRKNYQLYQNESVVITIALGTL